jgi:magnesium-transporting ATPase (P-type)
MTQSLPWNLPLGELLHNSVATPDGLSDQEAKRRLAVYGPNNAMVRRRRRLWRQILDRLANPLILILLFASGLSAWTGEVTSFVIIVVIILLSVTLDVCSSAAPRRPSMRYAAPLDSRRKCSAMEFAVRFPSTSWFPVTW